MITVLTATTGHPRLEYAIRSVQAQCGVAARHVVIIDGAERQAATEVILNSTNFNGDVIVVPRATGHSGYNGHLIYSCIPFVLDCQYVALLDEDNIYENNHLSSLFSLCESDSLEWAYSLRKVFIDDSLSMEDNCQSLGWWPAYNGPYHLIDTSCYFVKKHVWKAGASIWDRTVSRETTRGPEFVFCEWLFHAFPRGFTSGEYSLKYWLGSANGPGAEARWKACQIGNAVNEQIYRMYPWKVAALSPESRGERMFFQSRSPALSKSLDRVTESIRKSKVGDHLPVQTD